MKIASKSILFVFLAGSIILLLSNSAQPGVWSAGGGGYHLLFPEDSLSFRKIQMQSEKIAILLYPGFAVVKGEYQMKNSTSDTISIKVGYPVHGIYSGNDWGNINQVTFNGLYKLKTLQNNKEVPILVKPINEHQPKTITYKEDNWYVWENTFLPNTNTTIEVYFIVNTNYASIRKGYDRNDYNAFIYLLESGSVWKQPIEKGTFIIQLKDGLTLKDVKGISNFDWKSTVLQDQPLLVSEKLYFSPTPNDNLVITYGKKITAFDFEKISNNYKKYFNEVNEFSNLSIGKNLHKYEAKDPYEVNGYFIYFLLIPFVVIGILFVVIAYLLIKVIKRKIKK